MSVSSIASRRAPSSQPVASTSKSRLDNDEIQSPGPAQLLSRRLSLGHNEIVASQPLPYQVSAIPSSPSKLISAAAAPSPALQIKRSALHETQHMSQASQRSSSTPMETTTALATVDGEDDADGDELDLLASQRLFRRGSSQTSRNRSEPDTSVQDPPQLPSTLPHEVTDVGDRTLPSPLQTRPSVGLTTAMLSPQTPPLQAAESAFSSAVPAPVSPSYTPAAAESSAVRAVSALTSPLSSPSAPVPAPSSSHAIPPQLLQPSPPRRNLRTRKPGQLNPYTVEMALYKRRLERNDWEDAVVLDRHFRRMMAEKAEKASADTLPIDAEDSTARRAKKAERRKEKQQRRDAEAGTVSSRAEGGSTISNGLDAEARRRLFARYGGTLSGSEASEEEESQPPQRLPSASKRRRLTQATTLATDATSSSDEEDAPRLVGRSQRRNHRDGNSGSSRGSSTEPEDRSVEDPSQPAETNADSASDSDASGTSIDYERYFRRLRRMMPLGMARKHIEDLRNMRKGKAYHSDGHVSDTPDPSSSSETDETGRGRHRTITPASSPPTAELHPGETRKRSNRFADAEQGEDRFEIVGDEESDESADPDVSLSPSSDSDSDTSVIGPEAQETDLHWWSMPDNYSARSTTSWRNQDDIDRMLNRNGTSKKARPARPRGTKATGRSRVSGSSRSKAVTRDRSAVTNSKQSTLNARPSKRKKTGQVRSAASRACPSYRGTHLGTNPPVAHPRMLRRLDLLDEDLFFTGTDGNATPLPPPPEGRPSYAGMESVDERQNRQNAASPPQLQEGRSPAHRHQTYSDQSTSAARRPFGRVTSNASADGAVASSRSPRLEVPSKTTRGPQPQRLEHTSPGPQKVVELRAVEAEQLEANGWADVSNLRLTFDISPLPAGVSFDPSTAIGKAELWGLLQLPKRQPASDARILRPLHLQTTTLSAEASDEQVEETLPIAFDELYTLLKESSTDEQGMRSRKSHAERIIRYLSERVSAPSLSDSSSRLLNSIESHVDVLVNRSQAAGTAEKAGEMALLVQWWRVELSWRSLWSRNLDPYMESSGRLDAEEKLVLRARDLMVSLLSRGLHRTIKEIRGSLEGTADSSVVETSVSGSSHVKDFSAELWVSLIHLLSEAAAHSGPHCSFWSVFESAFTRWRALMDPGRRPVIVSESLWYCIFALCSLSQFSPSTGISLSTPQLHANWILVVTALTAVKLRYSEGVEARMSSAAMTKRDRYIRTVIQRCHCLSRDWHWSMNGSEAVLATIFNIFNVRKLADLPSEQDHDFPAFLRHFDLSLLLSDSVSREDSSYHIFLKLLALAGKSLQESSVNPQAADRAIARVFSRISPVRVMAFSKTNPPTAIERSSLFNHYAVAMVHLALVPSAAAHRFRQIKSFLVFHEADAQSQIACIRAMVYAAVILRHFQMDLSSICTWFVGVVRMLRSEVEQWTTGGTSTNAEGYFESQRRLRRAKDLLIVCLRSVQHIIQRSHLGSGSAITFFPDRQLLDKAWIGEMLESQAAIDPVIGLEVLECVRAFLIQRNQVVDAVSRRPKTSTSTLAQGTATASESQNSFSDLFDDEDVDFDFTDPAIDNLLDGPSDVQSPPRLDESQVRSADRVFAATIRDAVSPSLFRLLSNIYHPDRALEGNQVSLGLSDAMRTASDETGAAIASTAAAESFLSATARRRYVEVLIDCWAGCSNVVVQNGLRDWGTYLNYGNESWKRIDDPIAKRDIGLRFLQNVLSLDATAYEAHQSEVLQTWFASAAARFLSIQADFTHLVFVRIDGALPWLRLVTSTWSPNQDLKGEDGIRFFMRNRLCLIEAAIDGMRSDYLPGVDSSALKRRSMIFPCLTAFLASIRAHVDLLPHPARRPTTRAGSQEYLAFCARAVQEIRSRAGETILRGLKTTLDSTAMLIEKKQASFANL